MQPTLKIEFFDGTPCEIVDGSSDDKFDKRSTTVEVTCGKQDTILSIQEDRTCHYHIKTTNQQLCKVAGFASESIKYKRVDFEPSTPIPASIETE